MDYIAHRRFKGKAICGDVNIPALTKLEEVNNVITYNGKPICYYTSENAHQFFSRNNDGNGMLRGNLTQAIQNTLKKRDRGYQKRWDKIWDDEICRSYKRTEYADFWLWNHDFFNADIDILQYIVKLIKAKEK